MEGNFSIIVHQRHDKAWKEWHHDLKSIRQELGIRPRFRVRGSNHEGHAGGWKKESMNELAGLFDGLGIDKTILEGTSQARGQQETAGGLSSNASFRT